MPGPPTDARPERAAGRCPARKGRNSICRNMRTGAEGAATQLGGSSGGEAPRVRGSSGGEALRVLPLPALLSRPGSRTAGPAGRDGPGGLAGGGRRLLGRLAVVELRGRRRRGRRATSTAPAAAATGTCSSTRRGAGGGVGRGGDDGRPPGQLLADGHVAGLPLLEK